MTFTLSQQTAYFLASIALGCAFAVLYDLVRAVRMLTRCSRRHILITDVLFFFVCGILTSLFALPFNKGDVRAFILFGEAVGFLTYRLTLGSIFGKFYAAFARLLRHFIRKICEKLKKIFDFLLKAGAFVLYNIVDLIDGIRRTAISGVRTLLSERRAAHSQPSSKRRHSRLKSERQHQAAVPHTAYYPIPLRGDRNDRLRNEHDQKRTEKRTNREKNRKSKEQRRR